MTAITPTPAASMSPIAARRLALGLALALAAPATAAAQKAAATDPLAALAPNQKLKGFRATALYLDAADRPMGARFVHERTGFTLDFIRQQSVPQGFVWVNTYPVSDQGEPHTQEHLLVAKGAKGRALGAYESAALVTENAFTMQWRTAYDFNTAAGGRAFYTLVARELDALLYPDYTDEEIRREVRNFGISDDPATKTARLEEKGSVYNEMVASSANQYSVLFRAIGQMTYGATHPLALSSGGTPEGIRTMQPSDIRAFHRAHYQLSNMGMIVAVPDSYTLGDVLGEFDGTLTRLQGSAPIRPPVMTRAALPAPKATAAGAIRIVGYPNRNAQQPSAVAMAWPAARELSTKEQTLLELFLQAFADDPTTNLYKKLVDTKTRTMDVGAKGVFASVSDDQGFPVYVGITDVAPSHINETELAAMRTLVTDELRRMAALPDGSPELADFEARVKSRIVATRRGLAKFVNSPPNFGARNTGSGWLNQLDEVNRTPGFRKSVTQKSDLRWADSVVSGRANPWRTFLAKWQLTSAQPWVVAARPDPALIEQGDAARQARAAAEVARLRTAYGVADDQDAIKRYRAEYDARSDTLDRIAQAQKPERLVDDLPMTLDDQIRYRVDTVGGVPIVSSAFASMTSVTTGLALGIDVVPADRLVYVAAMPGLLTGVGTVRGGTPLSYEQMSERLRREILSLNATFSTNLRTGRAELVLRGSGNDVEEGRRALDWMTAVLTAPDWRPENLSRIRDLVDQQLTNLRNTPQGAPEGWVQGIANAYRRQDSPVLLATTAYATRAHYLQRLHWLLRDPGAGAQRTALDTWLAQLAALTPDVSRADRQAMLRAIGDSTAANAVPATLMPVVAAARKLPAAVAPLVADAARDMQQALVEVPDATLGSDWVAVVNEIRQDLLVPPATALATLDSVRRTLLAPGNARAFVIGSEESRRAIAPQLSALVATLDAPRPTHVAYSSRRAVDDRLRARAAGLASSDPMFVGLVDPNMQGGVFLNSVPGPTYADTSARALTRYLASKLYAGGGAHAVFSKTIAAGLAYSNGLGGSPTAARLSYYAERTPELPQTLGFVINEIKRSPHDTSLVDYALGLAFSEVRSAQSFEQRGEAMANDLADGVEPAKVRAFRQALKDLRRTTPTLGNAMYAQMDSVYAQLLPGYFPGMPNVPGAVYFVIGNDKQFAAYEKYLQSAVAPNATLYRLYPRDFWPEPQKRVDLP